MIPKISRRTKRDSSSSPFPPLSLHHLLSRLRLLGSGRELLSPAPPPPHMPQAVAVAAAMAEAEAEAEAAP